MKTKDPYMVMAIDELNRQAWESRFNDLPHTQRTAWQAYEQAVEIAYVRGIAESLRTLGLVRHLLAHDNDALRFALRAYDLFLFIELENMPQQITLLMLIGAIYREIGNYSEALTSNLQALKLSREFKYPLLEPKAISQIGVVYIHLKDYANALRNFEMSHKLAQDGQTDIYISRVHHQRGAHQNALEYAQKSLHHHRRAENYYGQTETLMHMGEVYLALTDHDTAFTHLQKALAFAQAIGSTYQEALCLIHMGEVLLQRGEYNNALLHAQQSLIPSEAPQINYRSHQVMAEIYRKMGDHEQALTHYEQFHVIKEGIYNEQAGNRLKSLQDAYTLRAALNEVEVQQWRSMALQQQIADRERAEEALHIANQKLRHEIDHREQLIGDLDAYAHTVAHDLKTPLALVIAYSNLLVGDLQTTIDETSMDWLQSIHEAGMKMNQIIDELLLLASSRRQEIVSQPIDMNRVIEETCNRLSFMISEHHAMIDIAADLPSAMGYATWVEEVWTNYISNAIKYGGRPPVVTLGATTQPDGRVRYWVRDNGNGLNPQDQQQVFTMFKRLGQTQIEVEGHGLGLSIVKRIVEKLGGEVGVSSTNSPGKGCEFYFILPPALNHA